MKSFHVPICIALVLSMAGCATNPSTGKSTFSWVIFLQDVKAIATTSIADLQEAENAFQTLTSGYTPADVVAYLESFGVSAANAAKFGADYNEAKLANGAASAAIQIAATLVGVEAVK